MFLTSDSSPLNYLKSHVNEAVIHFNRNSVGQSLPTDLRWVTGVAVGDDVSHEGAVFDVLVITSHVDSVFSRLRGPVADVT